MMKLRSEVQVEPLPRKIGHADRILTIGSCFADNMARFLKERFFRVLANPYGVLYNPLSIGNALEEICAGKVYAEADLVRHADEWHSLQHHSEFSSSTAQQVLQMINERLERARTFLEQTGWLIITLGTARVWYWKPTGGLVANCHKIPAANFSRRRLTADEVSAAVRQAVAAVRSVNPAVNCILSVSPIRHWQDGAVDNQLSKSTLIVGLHEALQRLEGCYYFPAYEIMMDDLRDYRFYEDNLLHPSELAVEYIWDRFRMSCLSPDCREAVSDFEKLARALKHRPVKITTAAHQKFVDGQLQLIANLQQRYPYADLHVARQHFEAQREGNGGI